MKKSSVSPVLAANPDSEGVVDGAAREEHRQEEGDELQAEGGDQGSGEAVLRRALPSPIMPTVSEIREHKTTHLPYRSWCDECVDGIRQGMATFVVGWVLCADHPCDPHGLRAFDREGPF